MTFIFKIYSGRRLPKGNKYFVDITINNTKTKQDVDCLTLWEREIDKEKEAMLYNNREFRAIQDCVDIIFPNRTKTLCSLGIYTFFSKDHRYQDVKEAKEVLQKIVSDFQRDLEAISPSKDIEREDALCTSF